VPYTSYFTREFLTRNNKTVVPHPPYFSLFPRLKIKLKGHHRSAESGACMRKGTASRAWWPVGPKLVFHDMAAPVPEIMDVSLYLA
jgi:hypothetical protein